MKVHLVLSDIKRDRDSIIDGSCSLVEWFATRSSDYRDIHAVWDEHHRQCFYDWDEHSGNATFPVKHHSLSPRDAYNKTHNLWSWFTRYGRSRRRLLNHCIKWFEERDL